LEEILNPRLTSHHLESEAHMVARPATAAAVAFASSALGTATRKSSDAKPELRSGSTTFNEKK
jgi:hypothetical protein